MSRIAAEIGVLDFNFENSPVRIIANRNCSDIKLGGLDLGPFEEGNEYETFYWVALELEKSGSVRFREDGRLNTAKLSKIQWTERVQAAGLIPRLPEDFYPKLRRCLSELKKDSARIPEKVLEHEKAKQLAQDIINSRLRKIVSIASAPAQTEQVLKSYSKEERYLHDRLYTLISEWRKQILEYEEAEK